MTQSLLSSRSLLGAAAGFLLTGMAASVAITASATPARAQAANAADLCTPDVMRLCDAFIPDADRIVVCLKQKRRQLSAGCRGALTATSASRRKSRKVRRAGN